MTDGAHGESKRSTESLKQIARLANRLTGSAGVTLSVFENGTQHVIGAAGPEAESYAGAKQDAGLSLCGVVVETGHPLVCDNTRADAELADHPAVRGSGVGAYLGFPLHDLDDAVLGSLCAWEPHPRAWTDELIADLRDLAGCASTQLSFARLAGERAQSETELRTQRVFDAAVLDSLAEGVVACDESGRLSLFNRALREIHGAEDSGDVDWATTYRLYSEDGERLLAADEVPLARAFAGERVVDEPMAVGSDDGVLRQFLATGTQLTNADGTRIGAVVAMRDVTDDRRRRRFDAAQLDAATRLADGLMGDAVSLVLDVLSTAFRTPDVAFVPDVPSGKDDHGEDVIGTAATGLPARGRVDARRAELAAPVRVGDDVAGLLHVVGEAAELHDQQAASFVTALAGLLSRQLELTHVRELADDLHRTRTELARVIDQVEDFVFSVEVSDDGPVTPVMSGNSAGVLGGDLGPDTDWARFFATHTRVDDRPEFEAWRAALRAGQDAQMTCRIVGVDGEIRWVWTRSKPRRQDGRLFVDGISTDVTQRHQLHLEREQLLREQARQVEDLKALDAAKSEFVATVAHEIRGPLGVVVTFADHALEALDEDSGPLAASMGTGMVAARRSAGLASRTAGHLQQVVENLFDLARYDAGALALQRDDIDLAALLADVRESAAPAALAGGLDLQLDLAAGDIIISADATKLRQALDNIVGNAVKFTPAGGSIRISCAVVDGTVEIAVTDTGIGIPPDDLPHLFSRFYRASNARMTGTPGTGLGLALARSIVEAHGGTIMIAPHDASGTTVTLCLPDPDRLAD